MTFVLSFCKEEAERLHNSMVTPAHLLLGLLRQKKNKAQVLLQELDADLSQLKADSEKVARDNQNNEDTVGIGIAYNQDASRILRLCMLEAKLMKSDVVDTEHLLLAILKASNNEASYLLEKLNISYDKMSQILKSNLDVKAGYEYSEDEADEDEEKGNDTGSLTSNTSTTTEKETIRKKSDGKTPVLDNFGTDLTKAAEEGLLDPVIGRSQEVERVAQILCRRKKNNPILIGKPGVGKSAIVEGLAQRIVQRHISRILWNKRIIMLDMANVVAGTKYRGQFEERIRAIIQELQKNPDIIIFIDEIHNIVGAGNAAGSMDAANMMKPALARGEIHCIGATTTDEYRKSIEKDGALERRFQKVQVDPTNIDETIQILENLKARYEDHHHVTYTHGALEACVRLTERFITDRSLPDKAIDALDEAGSRMHIQDVKYPNEILALESHIQDLQNQKLEAAKKQNFELAADLRDKMKQEEETLKTAKEKWEKESQPEAEQIDEKAIAEVVSMMSGIPVHRIGQEENERLRNLNQILQKKVIGQNSAIETVVKAIQRGRVGLKDPNKPTGIFLFVGPTGVGKTYLTKCLAEELFGSADNIIRVDMSEYMEKHTVSRMVGAPPGYVGYEEGGQLTEKVRRKPYSIVLLDEIEKAHQDVFNILLQMMDEGRMTDGNGATVDFKNTVIVMTSNCGTRQIKDFGHGIGFSHEGSAEQDKKLARSIIEKAIQKQFAPEFLNRIDNVVYFDQLDEEAIQRIVEIELKPLANRVHSMGYELEVEDSARLLLGKKGYDVQYGARPLKRAIQELVEDPLCEVIMEGVPQGAILVATTNDSEKIEIKVK